MVMIKKKKLKEKRRVSYKKLQFEEYKNYLEANQLKRINKRLEKIDLIQMV